MLSYVIFVEVYDFKELCYICSIKFIILLIIISFEWPFFFIVTYSMDGTNYSWSLVPQMPKGNLEIRNLHLPMEGSA